MKIPATMRIDVALSPVQRMLIEELRGTETPEQFLRRMIELGLTELMQSMARFHLEDVTYELATGAKNHEAARATLFHVKDAGAPPPATEGPTLNAAVSPIPNHIPRGARR